ncbi:hypothetical protein ACVGOW_21405 [Pseudonocardia saturnea]
MPELPEVPQVACFVTAFHATLPAAAHTYAVPRRWVGSTSSRSAVVWASTSRSCGSGRSTGVAAREDLIMSEQIHELLDAAG